MIRYRSIYKESTDRDLFVSFINSLEMYQSNHYGSYDRTILLDAYIKLPDEIKNKIAYIKKNIFRGCDGLSYRAVMSFTSNERYAKTFGTFVLPLSQLQSYLALVDTAKITKVSKAMKVESNVGDDEGEVLVFDGKWKNFDIEEYRV